MVQDFFHQQQLWPKNLGGLSCLMISTKALIHFSLSMSKSQTPYLVGGFNPFENGHQTGSSPQVGVKIQKHLKPPPRYLPSSLNCLVSKRLLIRLGYTAKEAREPISQQSPTPPAEGETNLKVFRSSSWVQWLDISYGKWWYPWDGTLHDQPHIHLIYWVSIGYLPF